MKRGKPLQRRTPLKRTGTLKRTPIRKKRKKANTNAWYRKKVIEHFMAQFRGQPCAICGKSERTCGHHLVSRRRCPSHIVSEQNIIVLCPLHHQFSNDIAPHSSNSLAVKRFLDWVAENRPEQYAWIEEHEHDQIKVDYRSRWEAINESDD